MSVRFEVMVGMGGMLLAAACGEDSGEQGAESLGTLSSTLSLDLLHDVAAVRYDVVGVGQTCTDPPLAQTTVALHADALPDGTEPSDASTEHPFTDTLFVLPRGDYRVCATPLAESGDPSTECARAETVASVFEGVTTEVILVSQCQGEGSGGVDATTLLNDPPRLGGVPEDTSQSITACEALTLTVSASDPNGDELSYAWAVTLGSALLMNSGNTATFGPAAPGAYEVTVRVTDVYAATTSLGFPIQVSGADCD